MKTYNEYLKLCKNTGARMRVIGKTAFGREILLLTKGRGAARTLIMGGVHAREHITSDLLFALTAAYRGSIALDIVPALNIDGILLVKNGLNGLPLRLKEREYLLKANRGNGDFSLWKANLRAVDINNNFDAGWGQGQGNVFFPAPSGYVGAHAGSEPETQAAVRLMDSGQYALVVAYHSKGEEVYWGFRDKRPHPEEARRVADALGYALKETPDSAGGLKDYWIEKTGRMGLTIEVGEDRFSHPYPVSELPALVKKHKDIFSLYGEIAERLWKNGL